MLIQKMNKILLLILFLYATTAAAAQTVTYFHNDVAGTPLLATDASGNVVWKENYYPYGERLNRDTNSNNKLWFTGKPYDNDTGLTYLGARYYNPLLGRFMGVDPIDVNPENIHSFNRYAYANNNPYKYVDLNGKWAEEAVGGLSLAISINVFRKDPSIFNGIILGIDAVLVATPFVPAFVGAVVHGKQALRAVDGVSDVAKGANKAPDFIVSPNGTAFPVPKGAQGPTPVVNQAGKQTGIAYTGGTGGANRQVDKIRIMDSTPSRGSSPDYPNGYIKYENAATQGVDPYTGRTLPNSQSHFPIE